METHYKLFRVRELADGDEDFVKALAEAFLGEVPEDAENLKNAVTNKDYYSVYQAAHKLKPTIDLFELGVLQDLIEVQDWGKFEKTGIDISDRLELVLTAIHNASEELKSDFHL
ncbi:MAG: Hpt domain-containing protein [Xanthomarina sp.]